MPTIPKLIIVLATFAVLVGAANGLPAQVAGATSPAQTQALKLITGELLSVDVDDMSFIVKLPNGSQVTILYTDETVVAGAEKGEAGLVTMSGTPVSVYFKVEGSMNIATRIELDPTANQG